MRRSDQLMALLGVAVLVVAVPGAFLSATAPHAQQADRPAATALLIGGTNISDTAPEGADQHLDYDFPFDQQWVRSFNVTLTWTDEPASARHQNQPDTFTLEVFGSEGGSPFDDSAQQTATNPQGGEGSISLQLRGPAKRPSEPLSFVVVVALDDAGDQTPTLGPSFFGFRTQADSSNAFSVEVSYAYEELDAPLGGSSGG